MYCSYLRCAIPVITFVCLISPTWSADAQATRFHDVELLLTHRDLGAGLDEFGLSVSQRGHSEADGPIDDGRLIAPDGTVFNAVSNFIRRSSLAQIAAVLVGDWSALEELNGVETSYEFSVSPASLDIVPTALPVITSPTPGANVGENFIVRWTFDDGGIPTGPGVGYGFSPNVLILDVAFELGTDYALRFETMLLEPGRELFEIQVFHGKVLPKPTLIGSSPALANDSFTLFAAFDAYSAPVAFHIVPEPSTFILLTIALLGASFSTVRRLVR